MNEELHSAQRWARLLGWTTFAGVICGLIGPYGSFIANPISRACFWISVFWAGTAILYPTTTLAISWARSRSYPTAFAFAVTVLLGCVPLALFARSSCNLFWPVHASGIRPQEWYVLTFILAAPAAALVLWLDHFLSRPQSTGPRQSQTTQPDGGERLPERMLDLVVCLQMEDHHVRVYTAVGSTLYYASMRDVVKQLGARGIQVHRSWWVAHGAVAEHAGDTRSLDLTLRNGVCAPVSRSRMATIKAAGWLKPSSRQEPVGYA